MECFIVEPADIDLEQRQLLLRGDEAHHAIRSLRLISGDELLATDLIGTCYHCRLSSSDKQEAICTIDKVLPNFGEPSRDVLLIQALISQPARWEFLLEKATELGVKAIQPIATERTERASFKLDRSERILRAAVKQTKRACLPMLTNSLSSLREALSSALNQGRKVILLHEEAEVTNSLHHCMSALENVSLAIVVGPEGGFTNEEVQMARDKFGAEIASLGPRRLRAETAAIAALAIVTA